MRKSDKSSTPPEEIVNVGALRRIPYPAGGPADLTPPEPPLNSNLILGEVTYSHIHIGWSASPNSAGDLAGYRVYRDGVYKAFISPPSLDYTDGTVEEDTAYEYYVTSIDSNGNESTATNTVSATTLIRPDTEAPGIPTNLVADTIGTNSVTLSWDAASDPDGDLAGYKLYRDGGLLATLGNVLTYTDTPLVEMTEYSYTLRSCDDNTPVANESVDSVALVITTDTSNVAPVASAVSFSGTTEVGEVLTGAYTYTDADSDVEGATTFRWLADDTAISGATNSTYTLAAAEAGKKIKFEVTPVASTGANLTGVTVISAEGVIIKGYDANNDLIADVSGTYLKFHVPVRSTESYTTGGVVPVTTGTRVATKAEILYLSDVYNGDTNFDSPRTHSTDWPDTANDYGSRIVGGPDVSESTWCVQRTGAGAATQLKEFVKDNKTWGGTAYYPSGITEL